jgi:hypothetical protein
MAVSLALNYVERNDNKLITLTDISTGWSPTPGNEINTLELQVSITTSDNVTVDYDNINLVLSNSIGPSTTQEELIFQIDASILKILGIPLGTAADILPDGIYEFKYILNNGDLLTVSTLDEFVLIEGNVRNGVYDAMRKIPTLYDCEECKSKEILDTVFAYAYLNSMRAGGYLAKTEELLSQLYVLERLLNYGSSYTW